MRLNEVISNDDDDDDGYDGDAFWSDEKFDLWDECVEELEALGDELEKHLVFGKMKIELDDSDLRGEPMLDIGAYKFHDKQFDIDKEELIKILDDRYKKNGGTWLKDDIHIYLSAGSDGTGHNSFTVSADDGEPRDR